MAFAEQTTHLVETDDDVDTEQDFSDYTETDDSDDDPSFTEALSGLSRLSVQKKKATSSRLESDLGEVVCMDLADAFDEVDQKSFEAVQSLIRGGKLEKLKIDQCKVYLRKYRLRLTGNKDTLIERIKEHIRILSGGGEREYPPSSFVLNCKGDACMGDVVMFEQRVYATYDLASRRGPPIGSRVIAGRIVKESYGAAKQQHTFTIEVLWSKGEKPLPPLHPLLIKGRNLYRMKTLRQKWEDETLRENALRDKHVRGEAARSERDMRILEKNMKKELRAKRLPRMNKDPARLSHPPVSLSRNSNQKYPVAGHDNQGIDQHYKVVDRKLESRTILGQRTNQSAQQPISQVKHPMMDNVHPHSVRWVGPAHRGFENMNNRPHHLGLSQMVYKQQQQHPGKGSVGSYHGMAGQPSSAQTYQRPPMIWEDVARSLSRPTSPMFSQHARRNYQHPGRQFCRYFAEGRCRFGSSCKFSHDQ
ncbi:unnamed protein product [Rhodiola kirilowii]